MQRNDRHRYFRQRPMLAAFVTLPLIAVGVGAAQLFVLLLDLGVYAAVALLIVGILAGSALSRLALTALMGPGR